MTGVKVGSESTKETKEFKLSKIEKDEIKFYILLLFTEVFSQAGFK